MTAPEARMALGTVLRAFTISSPMVEALSTPPNAKAIVDQKMTSFRLVLGTKDRAVMAVADPKRLKDTTPRPMRTIDGIQPATAPTLFSHLPTFSPTTFMETAIRRPTVETARK